MSKLEITTPRSFFKQLADALQLQESVSLDLEDIPKAYQESPANLCAKLRTRAKLNVTYTKVGQLVIFKNESKTVN